jgi:hypothetical protein
MEDRSLIERLPHMRTPAVTICKNYDSIFTLWLSVDFYMILQVDTTMANKNLSIQSLGLHPVKGKPTNTMRLKPERLILSLSNMSETPAEIILSLLTPISHTFHSSNVSILKNGVSWSFLDTDRYDGVQTHLNLRIRRFPM